MKLRNYSIVFVFFTKEKQNTENETTVLRHPSRITKYYIASTKNVKSVSKENDWLPPWFIDKEISTIYLQQQDNVTIIVLTDGMKRYWHKGTNLNAVNKEMMMVVGKASIMTILLKQEVKKTTKWKTKQVIKLNVQCCSKWRLLTI